MDGFDPDAYLNAASSGGFDPDAYLGTPTQSANAPPSQATVGSLAAQTGLGAAEGALDLTDAADPFGGLKNAATSVANAVLGTNYPAPTNSRIAKSLLGLVNANPDQYPAQNTPEKVARVVGSMLPGAVLPMGEAGTLAEAATPTVDALKAAASAAYKSPEVKALKFAPQAMQDLGQNIANRLMDADIHPLLAPKTYGIIDQMTTVPEGTPFVTAANVQTLRRVLGKAATSTDPTERLAAQTAQHAVDDFMVDDLPSSPHVLDGDPDAAATKLAQARGDYAAAMRTDRLNDAMDKASRQAARAGMGGNLENATRQRIAEILNSPAKSRGLSDDERAALEGYVQGNFTRNSLRVATKILGGDNPLMAAIHAGLAFPTGGLSLAAPMTGFLLKKINNAISDRELGRINELLRSRSPFAESTKQAISDWAKAHLANKGWLSSRAQQLSNRLKGAGMSANPALLAAPLQSPSVSLASDQNQQDIPGPPAQQHNGGKVKDKQAFAHGGKVKKKFFPQSIGARRARDGRWYIRDKSRPGKYLMVIPHAG